MRGPRRPAHWSEHNASAFQLAGVVENYHLRAPYPSSLAPFLSSLAAPRGGRVLELGCGTGEITRILALHTERIDAIDVSRLMIEKARTMPGADHPAIRWIEGRAEDAPFDGPYALAVAGASLHWMDWEVTLPRIAEHLAPGAVLAIVVAVDTPPPWSDALRQVIGRHSVIQNFEAFDLPSELETRQLFKRLGETKLQHEPFTRSVDEYIEALHATSGLPRERMTSESANVFDSEVRTLVAPFARTGALELSASAEIVWGTPAPRT